MKISNTTENFNDEKFLKEIRSKFSSSRGRRINEANRIALFRKVSDMILSSKEDVVRKMIIRSNNASIEDRKSFCAILLNKVFHRYSDNQKAAIFGYIGAESGWMSAVLNNNAHKAFSSDRKGSGAFGYGQWLHFSRVANMAKFISDYATKYHPKAVLFLDPYTQLLFIKHEIESSYYRTKMKKFFTTGASLIDCVRDFKTYFGGHTDSLYSEAPYERKAKEFFSFEDKKENII